MSSLLGDAMLVVDLELARIGRNPSVGPIVTAGVFQTLTRTSANRSNQATPPNDARLLLASARDASYASRVCWH